MSYQVIETNGKIIKTWANGETMVPEHALPSLAQVGIAFLVKGQASYEQLAATVRNPPATAVQ